MTSILKYKSGEIPQLQDKVQYRSDTGCVISIGLGVVFVIFETSNTAGHIGIEKLNLIRRDSEAEDRDPKYEYYDGEPLDVELWEPVSNLPAPVFRRLRQPACTAPGAITIAPHPVGAAADRIAAALWPTPAFDATFAPAKPRRMKATRSPKKNSPHHVEHDELEGCAYPPACEPVDPPKFEAKVCEVVVGADGVCRLKGCKWAAYVGAGAGDGYTITMFCESKEIADELAQNFRDHGILQFSFRAHDGPLCRGKPLPFAVAVKVTK